MSEKYEALVRNNTWTLVNFPKTPKPSIAAEY